jgi:transcriptional regulator with XRE-family HTH domain
MIHDTLRLIRVFHKYSIDKTAVMTAINPSNIRSLEAGELDVSDEIIDRYATAFRLEAKDIRFFLEKPFMNESKASVWARGRVTGAILGVLELIARELSTKRDDRNG